jgi:hypothetical protein
MKKIIEVEDNLEDFIDNAFMEIKNEFEERVLKYPDETAEEILEDLDDEGIIHEIIDGSVPIYTWEIEGLWFLYGNRFEEAYKNAGIDDNVRAHNGMAAIFFFIEQEVREQMADFDWEEFLNEIKEKE